MLNYKHVLVLACQTHDGAYYYWGVSYRLKIKWYIHDLLWDMILKALKWISMLQKIL